MLAYDDGIVGKAKRYRYTKFNVVSKETID